MRTKLIITILFYIVLTTENLLAKEKAPPLPQVGVGLTIYNDNFAVVKERRQMDFTTGVNKKSFTNVASSIEPASVNFECLSSPGAVVVLEQNYEYDLVSTASLLKRYIDKKITVSVKGSGADIGKEVTGILSAAMNNDIIIQKSSGEIEIVNKNNIENISLQQLPDDLVTKPTLIWLAQAAKADSELCQVTYTTSQINWKADYSAVLNPDENAINITGWVTIDNKSGAAYKDAKIKLIAGDVRRIKKPEAPRRKMYAMEMAANGRGGFEEKAFMEYHLYTLGRDSTINNNQVKQIELIAPALAVPVEKIYLYDRQQKADKVQIKFEFENTEENYLGIALPKGKVRVFKRDPADGMLEFVGEDSVDHTPKKEKLSLYIGNAFDIVPEHKMIDSKVGRRMRFEKHQIELRNRKDEPVTICVDEKFPQWVNWKIGETTHKYKKHDARTARFKINIDANSTATLEYSATQQW